MASITLRRAVPTLSRGFSSTPLPRAAAAAAAAPRPTYRRASPPSSSVRAAASAPPPAPTIDDFDSVNSALPPPPEPSEPLPIVSAAVPSALGGGLAPFPNDSYRPLAQLEVIPGEQPVRDWTTSFAGLSERPFPKEAVDALMKSLEPQDVEIKPDGLLYLPEIKYRRTLNAAFGPGGWGLAPRGETHVTDRMISREWGLVCLGRLVSVARGEQEFFDRSGIPTATEGCKSNALMRCCKDLGIASELWDPSFIRTFKDKHCVEVYCEHATTKKRKKLWRKKNAEKFDYPWKETR